MRYMLDSNAVRDFIKEHPALVTRVTAASMAALCISAITEAELLVRLAKRPAAKRLPLAVREFLNLETAVECARVCRDGRARQGETTQPGASSAVQSGA